MPKLNTKKYAIILDGPIGVGKTTYGRFLAERFTAQFLDGDDFSEPSKPWYGSSLSTSHRIFETSRIALESSPLIFIGYPIRCTNWIFFIRKFQAVQVETVFVGLQAPLEDILSKKRSRRLSPTEIERTREMINQGYGARRFCNFFVHTNFGTEEEVTEMAAVMLKQELLDLA